MLTRRALHTMERFGMVRPGGRVLIGLSGGPDSVALTHILAALRADLDVGLVAAHLNHGLRPESDDDETFCRALAEDMGLLFTSGRADVISKTRSTKRSIEDEARRARYAFLEETAARHRCQHIAVGHTMDDQAETFLMRLARGSGLRGLAAVYPVVRGVPASRIRPLIEIRREEILAYLEEHGLLFRDDATNLDRRFTRNRVRHDVLPYLSEALNPSLVETLARSAAMLRDDEDFMESAARAAFDTAASSGPGRAGVRLSIPRLEALHPAIRRRVIRRTLQQVRGDIDNISIRHVDDVLALIAPGKSGKQLDLPRAVAERSFDELRLASRARDSARGKRARRKNGYNGFEYRLTIPAKLSIRECQGLLTAHLGESIRAGDEPGAAAGNAVVAGVEDGVTELRVRSPRPSDRFRPLGAPGTKPLSRYLMERRVAKGDRTHVPLVVRADADDIDDIIWVVGHSVSETARLGAGRRRLYLEWKGHE